MSIINQALKKAQREQLLHDGPTIPHLTPSWSSRSIGRWYLIIAGFIGALGVGAALHAWVVASGAHKTVVARPQHRPGEVAAPTPHKLPALPPPAAVVTASQTTPVVSGRQISPASQAVRSAPTQSAAPKIVVPVRRPPRRHQPAISAPPITKQPPPPSKSTPASQISQAHLQARLLYNQALDAKKSRLWTRVLTLLQQAIKLDPTLKQAYNSLGNLYYQQQQYHQALAMYQQALAIDANYIKARTNLGSTYLQLAMHQRALEELQKVIQTDSTYGLAYYNLACVYARAGDSRNAVHYLQQAIMLVPQARSWAQSDDDFARIRRTPEMRQLLGSS